MEIPDEDPFEIRPVVDAVKQEEFEPCSNMLSHADGELLNDEVVIIHCSGSVGESKVFEPYTGIRFFDVFGDVGGWSEALWERRSLDAPAKGPWSRAIRARTPVVWPVTMPGVRFTAPLDGLDEVRVAYPHCRPMDVIIMPDPTPVADAGLSPRCSCIGGRCGSGARLGHGAVAASYSMPGGCSGEWME